VELNFPPCPAAAVEVKGKAARASKALVKAPFSAINFFHIKFSSSIVGEKIAPKKFSRLYIASADRRALTHQIAAEEPSMQQFCEL
jgi:hypothetical protein